LDGLLTARLTASVASISGSFQAPLSAVTRCTTSHQARRSTPATPYRLRAFIGTDLLDTFRNGRSPSAIDPRPEGAIRGASVAITSSWARGNLGWKWSL